jgi:D-alanyl-D-alanine carboxypeptidase
MLLFIFCFPSSFSKNGEADNIESYNEVSKEPKKSKEPALEELPKVSPSDWNLQLVNYNHEMNSDNVNLEIVQDGFKVDSRIVSDVNNLLTEAAAAGESLKIFSAYRSFAEQANLEKYAISEKISQGLSEEEAKREANYNVAQSKFSEHHTGLAIDISKADFNSYSPEAKSLWMEINAWKYGFIPRYPENKKDITKVNYEPWHYRYVGKESAEHIVKNNLTLEEYLELLNKNNG